MLRGVGELLPRRRMPGLVHHGGSGATRAADACAGEARGAAPTKIVSPMMAAAASIGVTARAAVVAAPVGGAGAAAAVTTAPRGAAAACAAPAESAAGGHACGAPAVSPPGPSLCSCSRTGGRACARSTRRVLRHQLPQKLPLTTWRRQAGKGEGLLGKEDEGAKKWGKPSRAPRL
jgi:hypothetical protein